VPMGERDRKRPDVLLIAQNIRKHQLPGDWPVKAWDGVRD
jgi:hypothetical protein